MLQRYRRSFCGMNVIIGYETTNWESLTRRLIVLNGASTRYFSAFWFPIRVVSGLRHATLSIPSAKSIFDT